MSAMFLIGAVTKSRVKRTFDVQTMTEGGETDGFHLDVANALGVSLVEERQLFFVCELADGSVQPTLFWKEKKLLDERNFTIKRDISSS